MTIGISGSDQPFGAGGYRVQRRFLAVADHGPGAAWRDVVAAHWPGWRDWYVARGGAQVSHPGEVDRALRQHMPELTGMIDRLSAHAPDDPALREFLSFWRPPRYLVGCTQAASRDAQGPFLIRNYDLDPTLNETTLLWSNWRGKAVMGMVEGLAGLSDGINENGLAVSLSFGGRVISGRGFGIPLIVRYVLETCTDVQDGTEALRSVPCHMSYNVTLTDRSGDAATVFLSPDRPAMVHPTPWATNHQLGVEWPRHGRISATLERARNLQRLFGQTTPESATLTAAFLQPPIFSRKYSAGFGTVFTTLYRPQDGCMHLFWGDGQGGTWDIEQFEPAQFDVEFGDQGSRLVARHQA